MPTETNDLEPILTPLENSQYEAFCQAAFTGENNGEQSAIIAHYSPNSARVQASQLLTIPNIRARIAGLKLSVQSQNIGTEIERQERLTEIWRARLTDFVDSDGNIDLTGPNNAALQEVTITNWRGGKDDRSESQTKKVKLHSPMIAIQEHNKMDGAYKPQGINLTGNVTITVVEDGNDEQPPLATG